MKSISAAIIVAAALFCLTLITSSHAAPYSDVRMLGVIVTSLVALAGTVAWAVAFFRGDLRRE